MGAVFSLNGFRLLAKSTLALFAFSLLMSSVAVAGERPTGSGLKGSGFMVFPVISPQFSSNFGLRKHPLKKMVRHHGGVDLAAPEGSHVRSVLDGTVVFSGNYAGYGKLVTIEHALGRTTLYGHLSEILVNAGQKVTAGDLIGRVGSTGLSSGPHLHFEWRDNGEAADPFSIFPGFKASPQG